ncbi:MAG: hypothetical protein PVF37_11695, partial [Desulfobacterales bacterium]
IASFRRRPESSKFIKFWMPDQVRHDKLGIFCVINKALLCSFTRAMPGFSWPYNTGIDMC